jgi:hypothetical protein
MDERDIEFPEYYDTDLENFMTNPRKKALIKKLTLSILTFSI